MARYWETYEGRVAIDTLLKGQELTVELHMKPFWVKEDC